MPRGVQRARGIPADDSETTPLDVRPVDAAPVFQPDTDLDPPAAPAAPPVPAADLSPDQKMIRELQDQLAKERGRKDSEPEFEMLAQPGSGENIVIHILEDGFTALGQIWYRGQELEFEVGSQAYKDTFDRRGQTWLSLAGDDGAQIDKWDRVMFRVGPWPGRSLSQSKVTFESVRGEGGASVPAPTAEDLARAEAAEAKRGRAVPRLQTIA